MSFYVIKRNDKYLQYSQFGFGYKWVDHLTKATQFIDKRVADTCCTDGCRVVEIKVEESEIRK